MTKHHRIVALEIALATLAAVREHLQANGDPCVAQAFGDVLADIDGQIDELCADALDTVYDSTPADIDIDVVALEELIRYAPAISAPGGQG